MLHLLQKLGMLTLGHSAPFEARGNAVVLKTTFKYLDQTEDTKNQAVAATSELRDHGSGHVLLNSSQMAELITYCLNLTVEVSQEGFREQVGAFLDKLAKEPPSTDPVDKTVRRLYEILSGRAKSEPDKTH